AENQGAVGNRRPRATDAVADRARRRSCTLRPDPQQAPGIDPGDRAAAGPNALHVDGWKPGHMPAKALTQPSFLGAGDAPLANQADVVARAASISNDGNVASGITACVVPAGDRGHC